MHVTLTATATLTLKPNSTPTPTALSLSLSHTCWWAGQVSVEARQALARISLVNGGPLVDPTATAGEDASAAAAAAMEVLADDYILPSEPVVVSCRDLQW